MTKTSNRLREIVPRNAFRSVAIEIPSGDAKVGIGTLIALEHYHELVPRSLELPVLSQQLQAISVERSIDLSLVVSVLAADLPRRKRVWSGFSDTATGLTLVFPPSQSPPQLRTVLCLQPQRLPVFKYQLAIEMGRQYQEEAQWYPNETLFADPGRRRLLELSCKLGFHRLLIAGYQVPGRLEWRRCACGQRQQLEYYHSVRRSVPSHRHTD
jgi:hypothetical protein